MLKIMREPENLIPIFVSIAIILFISSIFVPFVLITIVQDIFFRPSIDFWFFTSPLSSYISVGITIAYFAVVFAILAIVQYKVEGKLKRKLSFAIAAFIPGFIIIGLSANQYSFFSDEGINRNTFFSTEEKHYDWEDFKKATYYVTMEDYRLIFSKLVLETETGEMFGYDFNQDFIKNRTKIRRALEAAGVEIEQVEIVSED